VKGLSLFQIIPVFEAKEQSDEVEQ
jgi:hypothetical protein